MSASVKTFYVLGWLFLVGSPIGFVIATLVQAPNSEGHSGLGPDIAKLVVASFAALPFMALGAILLIVGVILKRRRG